MLRQRVCLLCRSRPHAAAGPSEASLNATGRRQLSATPNRSQSLSRGEPTQAGGRSRIGTYVFAGAVSLAAGYAASYVTRVRREGEQKQELDPETFTPLTVTRNVMCTSPARPQDLGDGDHKLVELRLPSASASEPPPSELSIWSIYAKQPEIQIERAYTPLDSPSQSAVHGALRLLVKRYAQGEMGRFIHLRSVGQELEIRGWCPTWDAKSNHPGKEIRHVYLVSDRSPALKQCSSLTMSLGAQLVGGTGITPAYQLINATLNREAIASPVRFTLCYATSKPSSFLLLPELRELQDCHKDRLSVHLWAESLGSDSSWSVSRLLGLGAKSAAVQGFESSPGRIDLRDLKRLIPQNATGYDDAVVLVCGPDG